MYNLNLRARPSMPSRSFWCFCRICLRKTPYRRTKWLLSLLGAACVLEGAARACPGASKAPEGAIRAHQGATIAPKSAAQARPGATKAPTSDAQ